MSGNLERITLKKDLAIPLITVREHLIRYIFALQDVYDKDVLDVACGTGYGMYLMSFFAKTVSGYDISKEAIEEARRFPYKCLVCLETRDLEKNGDLSNHKVKQFDVIICYETLEHLGESEFLIANIRKYLKPKGSFYFSVPNRPDLKDSNPWHKRAFNITTINALIEEYFSGKQVQWFGQDQFGLSNNLGKAYLVGKVII